MIMIMWPEYFSPLTSLDKLLFYIIAQISFLHAAVLEIVSKLVNFCITSLNAIGR